MVTKETKSFKRHLEELAEILEWFDSQEELDIEEALKKIKSASVLIKISKEKLGEIENEFKILKDEVEKK